jgi:hypothetical protein
MEERRSLAWYCNQAASYRKEARLLRERAATAYQEEGLRDSYLALAREYDRLANVLEKEPS